ncbi:MAG TPA: hypothetical protein VJ696_08270, partial [Rhodanobacteraceae bacterium]|nr:hypothetical protein [Rhodanobacteraceae bacterium]
MHGRDLDIHPSDAALAAALRALPESAPAPDLWPDLASALAARTRRRRLRYAIPFAAAAALAIALLLPRLATREPVPVPVASNTAPAPSVMTPAAAPVDELAALHKRSRTLERWIAAISARAPQDGRDLMAAVEVEDLIGLVDVQLGGAHGEADALPLWRQRVALL